MMMIFFGFQDAIAQISNSSTTDITSQIIPGGSSSSFIVQDFAVIMIIAAAMLAITYKLKQLDTIPLFR
ncbi:MAG: hypothetical protein ACRD5B_12130 [Nitrososphaeraceae archaeon]